MRVNNFEPRNYFLWFLMALQAGIINAGGFLACHRFVTHTTGFATHFGVEFANNNYWHALGMLSVPLFFLMGAMVASFLVDRKKLKNELPNYSFVFLIVSLLMLFAAIGGREGVFGIFGSELQIAKAYFLLAALSMASGLQNAAINPANGSGIRTTHLTGLTTDIGVGLVRLFSKSLVGEAKQKEVLFNWIRIGLILSFIIGSIISAYLFFRFQYAGFFLPAFISFSVFAHLQYLNVKEEP